MTDEQATAAPGDPANGATPGPAARDDTWDVLGRQLAELGGAISRVVRAAVHDPDNRRHAEELKTGLEDIARQIGDAIDDAAETPQGQRVREGVSRAAETVAEAGRRVADDIRPHLIDAARTASERLRETAADLEQRARSAASPDASPATGAPAESGEPSVADPAQEQEDRS